MTYVLRGSLCGMLCDDCDEALSGLTLRAYRTRHDEHLAAAAAASPKDTLAIISAAEADAKAAQLLGEALIDEQGNFVLTIAEESYQGGALDIDLYCGSVPHLPPHHKTPAPIQLSITTLAPQWRLREDQRVAAWSYCIPNRYWCEIRARFGAWVICGRVVTCQEGDPIPGVIVSAFDADWLQDDALGQATTDPQGHFRIDYLTADFEKTPFPWLNVELVPGPDLYFRITSPGGDVLLNEQQSKGRVPGRENVGHCFCVELCLEQPPVVAHAWFTHVGDFDIYADINPADGKAAHAVPFGPGAHAGAGFGFYDGWYGRGIKLIGDCPTTHPAGGQPMRYRFLTGAPGAPLSALSPITAGQITMVQVGTRPITWLDAASNPYTTFQSIMVGPLVPAGATAAGPPPAPGTGAIPPEVLVPDANGWVTVDPQANLHGFSGPLLCFKTASVVPGGAAPGNGAGNPVATPEVGTAVQIVFQAEPVTGATGSSPTLSNTLDRLFISNWSAVNELDILEFIGTAQGCCSPLTTSLDILYTAEHELMSSWALTMTSCAFGGGLLPPPLPSGAAPGGFGTVHEAITNPVQWPVCSYIVGLSTTRALTDGEMDDPGTSSQKSFCISR